MMKRMTLIKILNALKIAPKLVRNATREPTKSPKKLTPTNSAPRQHVEVSGISSMLHPKSCPTRRSPTQPLLSLAKISQFLLRDWTILIKIPEITKKRIFSKI
jgi:hypothetical protein